MMRVFDCHRMTAAAAAYIAAIGFANAGCIVGVSPGNSLNVRGGPSTGFAAIGSIRADTCGVTVTNRCQRNWCYITHRGTSGWASMKFIDRDSGRPAVIGAQSGDRATPNSSRYHSRWELLGARKVDFTRDRDVIPVGKREGRFDAL